MTVTGADAAFLLGTGGSTKRKVARAAGARLDLDSAADGGHVLTVSGSVAARCRAMDYARWVLKQRHGAIEVEGVSNRDDLSVVRVPADCVAYVTGKSGRVLRSVEEEFGTLMFFGTLVGEGGERVEEAPDRGKPIETLCVLGDRRGRRGAELKVMSAVEHKVPGWYVNDENKLRARLKQPGDGEGDGFGYDVFPFEEHEFSYALGARVRDGFSLRRRLGSFPFFETRPRRRTPRPRTRTRAHFHVDPPSASPLGVRSPKELLVSADQVTGLRMCSGSRARTPRARESLLVYPHIFARDVSRFGFVSRARRARGDRRKRSSRRPPTSDSTRPTVAARAPRPSGRVSVRPFATSPFSVRRARRAKSWRRRPARFSSTSAARR